MAFHHVTIRPIFHKKYIAIFPCHHLVANKKLTISKVTRKYCSFSWEDYQDGKKPHTFNEMRSQLRKQYKEETKIEQQKEPKTGYFAFSLPSRKTLGGVLSKWLGLEKEGPITHNSLSIVVTHTNDQERLDKECNNFKEWFAGHQWIYPNWFRFGQLPPVYLYYRLYFTLFMIVFILIWIYQHVIRTHTYAEDLFIQSDWDNVEHIDLAEHGFNATFRGALSETKYYTKVMFYCWKRMPAATREAIAQRMGTNKPIVNIREMRITKGAANPLPGYELVSAYFCVPFHDQDQNPYYFYYTLENVFLKWDLGGAHPWYRIRDVYLDCCDGTKIEIPLEEHLRYINMAEESALGADFDMLFGGMANDEFGEDEGFGEEPFAGTGRHGKKKRTPKYWDKLLLPHGPLQ